MKFQDFNGTTVLRNGDGDTYPMIDSGTVSLDPSDSISGNSLRVNLTNPAADHDIQIQFNPYNYAGTPGFPQAERAFARDYSANPAAWQFNTYNRFSFWFQRPTSVSPLDPGGNFYDVQIGTYVKQVTNADSRSDEIGGNHYYHLIGVPNFGAGTWTHVILNMHPDHVRSENRDPGFVQYPTAVGGPNGGDDPPSTYNYFDTLTRFYIDDLTAASPCTFRVDDFTFYKEPDQENDQQVFALTSTYMQANNRLLITWKHEWDNGVDHEVRYAFSNIHQLGWSAATPAPGGIITPPDSGAYNGMVYDTTALPLSGHSVVYIAIKPQNSNLFTQIAVPLDLP